MAEQLASDPGKTTRVIAPCAGPAGACDAVPDARVMTLAASLPDCCRSRFFEESAGACFSRDRKHREILWRRFEPGTRDDFLTAFLLNPSIADENDLDPTLRRVERFTRDWKHNGFIVINAFSLVSTDPAALSASHLRRAQRITAATDDHIGFALRHPRRVLLGWGTHLTKPNLEYRRREILHLLHPVRERVFVWATNADGSPKHPLYVRADTSPRPWSGF